MKLLVCRSCKDVVALSVNERRCHCGAVGGRYRDDGHHAEYDGDALAVGLSSPDIVRNLLSAALSGPVEAWVMPSDAPRLHQRPSR